MTLTRDHQKPSLDHQDRPAETVGLVNIGWNNLIYLSLKNLLLSRVSHTSGFSLQAIVSPVNSAQYLTMPCNSRTVACSSPQWQKVPCNGILIGDPRVKKSSGHNHFIVIQVE